ncbi:MAG: hypothetical protein ABI664_19800 [bacterium]
MTAHKIDDLLEELEHRLGLSDPAADYDAAVRSCRQLRDDLIGRALALEADETEIGGNSRSREPLLTEGERCPDNLSVDAEVRNRLWVDADNEDPPVVNSHGVGLYVEVWKS